VQPIHTELEVKEKFKILLRHCEKKIKRISKLDPCQRREWIYRLKQQTNNTDKGAGYPRFNAASARFIHKG
jgi:hypothetical protein